MLLLGNQQDRSIIDRIGTALQQRAAQEGIVSPSQQNSPEPTSSPQPPKRSASTLACDTKCKKPLFSAELFKGESVEDDLSDSDTSDQLTNEETTSNECISPRLNPAGPSPNDVFCSVPGRLSLLSSTSKYKVTVGEIQRRLSQPENLNASILGGILRRAKSKNGGKELRETLEKLGLNLPAGRRKSATVTLLTSLVEGEAQHLARDYSFIAESEFNALNIARHVTEQHKKNNENLDKRKQALTYATKIIQEFIEILGSDNQQQNNVSPKVIDPALQNELTHFSLCTHGFGTPAMLASMNACMRYVQASLECLEKPTDSFNQAQQALMMALNGQSDHFNNVFQSEIFKMATAHTKITNNKLSK